MKRNVTFAKGIVDVALTPFAKGGLREAFACTVTEGTLKGFKQGKDLVMKAMQAEHHNRKIRMTLADIAAQDEASRLAKIFNEEEHVTKGGKACNIIFKKSKLTHMPETIFDHRGMKVFLKGESVAVEERINGEFEKFNSNSGWSCGNAKLPDAFSHWTWVATDGERLVCDIQGCRGQNYVLTDPAICSKDQEFGITDLGELGIANWFKHHECNDLCRKFGLKNKRPDSAEKRPKRIRPRRGSTFADEL